MCLITRERQKALTLLKNWRYSHNEMKETCVLFFDGYCGLCDGFVTWLLKVDKHKRIQFASLQSEVAEKVIPKSLIQKMETLVLIRSGQLYTQSEAFFEIVRQLSFPYRLLLIFQYFPKKLRDQIYDWISRNRYKVFGRRDTCRMPLPDERHRFLS